MAAPVGIGGPVQRDFQVMYAPRPQQPPNVFAAFMAGFLQTRLPDARDLYHRRLAALDPSARQTQIGDLLKQRAELIDRAEQTRQKMLEGRFKAVEIWADLRRTELDSAQRDADSERDFRVKAQEIDFKERGREQLSPALQAAVDAARGKLIEGAREGADAKVGEQAVAALALAMEAEAKKEGGLNTLQAGRAVAQLRSAIAGAYSNDPARQAVLMDRVRADLPYEPVEQGMPRKTDFSSGLSGGGRAGGELGRALEEAALGQLRGGLGGAGPPAAGGGAGGEPGAGVVAPGGGGAPNNLDLLKEHLGRIDAEIDRLRQPGESPLGEIGTALPPLRLPVRSERALRARAGAIRQGGAEGATIEDREGAAAGLRDFTDLLLGTRRAQEQRPLGPRQQYTTHLGIEPGIRGPGRLAQAVDEQRAIARKPVDEGLGLIPESRKEAFRQARGFNPEGGTPAKRLLGRREPAPAPGLDLEALTDDQRAQIMAAVQQLAPVRQPPPRNDFRARAQQHYDELTLAAQGARIPGDFRASLAPPPPVKPEDLKLTPAETEAQRLNVERRAGLAGDRPAPEEPAPAALPPAPDGVAGILDPDSPNTRAMLQNIAPFLLGEKKYANPVRRPLFGDPPKKK